MNNRGGGVIRDALYSLSEENFNFIHFQNYDCHNSDA